MTQTIEMSMRKKEAEESAREAGHDLGPWTLDGEMLTSSCQNEGCRADTGMDVVGGAPRGTATWGNTLKTQCPMS